MPKLRRTCGDLLYAEGEAMTDAEPDVPTLLKWCDHAIEFGNVRVVEHVPAIARALKSRLSHPTLSADRLAEIQKRHERDRHRLGEGYSVAEAAHADRAELLAALKQ